MDAPANEVPGWLVMKSTNLEGILEEAMEVHEDLGESLVAAGPYLGDAPEDVQAAAETLGGYVHELLEKAEEPEQPKTKLTERLLSVFKRKEEIDMNRDELNEILDERDSKLLKSLGDQIEELTKSLTPAEPVAEGEPAVEAVDTATTERIETLEKALESEVGDHEATREALVKAFERIENLEKAAIRRTSVEGQEDAVTKSTEQPKGLAGVLERVAKGEAITIC